MQNGIGRVRLTAALMYCGVCYNEPETGAQVVLHVGHLHPTAGLKVLAVGGGDPIQVVMEGGAMQTIPAGSIVSCDPADAEPRAVPRQPVVRKPVADGEPEDKTTKPELPPWGHRDELVSRVYRD